MHSRLGFLSFLVLFVFTVSAQQLGDLIYSSDTPSKQEVVIGNLGYQLYQVQIQIGEHQLSGAMPLVQDDALILLNTLRDLSSYRLIAAMQQSSNRTEIFDSYVEAMQSSLYATNATQLQITSEINALSSAISLCEDQKEIYDKNYLDALSTAIPTQNLDAIIQLSQVSSSCVAKNNALLAAKQQLSDSISAQSFIVGERYDYLIKERDIILSHFDLLHSDYLQTVLDTQQSIQEGNY